METLSAAPDTSTQGQAGSELTLQGDFKKTNRPSPTSQHSYFRNEAGLGQCLDDPVWTCQWLREDRTVSGGVREPEAVALAPVGDRADSRVLSGPLEGSQKLARRSGAHPLVVSRPGSRQESI